MTRPVDKPLTAALWLAIFGAAASTQSLAGGARCTSGAQTGASSTTAAAEARPGAPRINP